MAMEPVGFTFMTEQASVGRKVQVLSSTSSNLTSVWLQVGIQVFAGLQSVTDFKDRKSENLLVSTFLGGGCVVARVLSSGKGAVVFPVALGRQ